MKQNNDRPHNHIQHPASIYMHSYSPDVLHKYASQSTNASSMRSTVTNNQAATNYKCKSATKTHSAVFQCTLSQFPHNTDKRQHSCSPEPSVINEKITYFVCRGAAHASVTLRESWAVTEQCRSWNTYYRGSVYRPGQLLPAAQDITTAISFF